MNTISSPPKAPPASARTRISAVVLTKNEAANLPKCLASLDWADEMLVVDSFSTDDTGTIAEQAGARVVQHQFANFAAQRNYAQSQASYDWVLFVDADERVSAQLTNEIMALAATGELERCNAYHIQRVHLISGRWFTTPPDRPITPSLRAAIRRLEVPRLYDRRTATWQRPLHEVVNVPGPRGVLNGVICHFASTNLAAGLESFNVYTSLEAAYLRSTGHKASVLSALGRGLRTLIYLYIFQGWFRYGENGLLMASIAGMSKFTNYAKLWELGRIESGQGIWTDADRQMLERYRVEDRD
jgi:glycosyltransferase involved in cell wall biosynthesis